MVNLFHHVFGRLNKLELWQPQTTTTDLKASNTNKRTATVFLIKKHFSLEELQSLCFDLDIEFDDLPGNNFSRRAEELVDYCDRHSKFNQLLTACRQKRPKAPWTAVLGLT